MTEKEMLHIVRHMTTWGYKIPKIVCHNNSFGIKRDDGVNLFHAENACGYLGCPIPGENPNCETWAVLLTWFEKPDYKISAIKSIREMTGICLKEAKELVESAPVVVLRGIPQDFAIAMANAHNDVGIQFAAMPEPNTFTRNPT